MEPITSSVEEALDRVAATMFPKDTPAHTVAAEIDACIARIIAVIDSVYDGNGRNEFTIYEDGPSACHITDLPVSSIAADDSALASSTSPVRALDAVQAKFKNGPGGYTMINPLDFHVPVGSPCTEPHLNYFTPIPDALLARFYANNRSA